MPNFLVTLPDSQTVGNQGEGAKAMVIFAADEAGARRAAEGRLDGDGNTQWSSSSVATVTELVVGLNLIDAGDEGWSFYIRISGGAAQTVDPIVASVDGKTKDFAKGNLGRIRLSVGSVTFNDGGNATYLVDDILTVAGGTVAPGGRAATMRVTTVSTGVITAIEMVDPGEYSVFPTTLTANPVTGGGGDSATMDITLAAVNSYEAMMGQMVSDLNAFADLTTSVDFSEGAAGTRLLTLATVGDDIGDATIEVEIRHNGTPETVLMSTLVDGGIAAAVLTAAIPASPLAPPRVHVFQHNPL